MGKHKHNYMRSPNCMSLTYKKFLAVQSIHLTLSSFACVQESCRRERETLSRKTDTAMW
jgi:hypothetical protein